jgi:uncharacterized alkaline shock family protein YloU
VRHDGHTIVSPVGTIRIEGEALAGLVVAAAELVDGARVRRPKRGLEVQVEDGRARVELELAARYGTVLPELGQAVQRGIVGALERAASLQAMVEILFVELDA